MKTDIEKLRMLLGNLDAAEQTRVAATVARANAEAELLDFMRGQEPLPPAPLKAPVKSIKPRDVVTVVTGADGVKLKGLKPASSKAITVTKPVAAPKTKVPKWTRKDVRAYLRELETGLGPTFVRLAAAAVRMGTGTPMIDLAKEVGLDRIHNQIWLMNRVASTSLDHLPLPFSSGSSTAKGYGPKHIVLEPSFAAAARASIGADVTLRDQATP